MWLATKRTEAKQGEVTTYYFKSLECEICKAHYPRTLSPFILDVALVGSKHYSLIDIEKPKEQNFIQLETISSNRNKSYSRAIYTIQVTEEKPLIKLGRGHDSDLKIEDISVSRVHAMIKLTKDGYVLEDNDSKFGTLFLLPPGPHEIPATDSLFIQFGRTTLGLTVREFEGEIKKAEASAYIANFETFPAILYYTKLTNREADAIPNESDSESQKKSTGKKTLDQAANNNQF